MAEDLCASSSSILDVVSSEAYGLVPIIRLASSSPTCKIRSSPSSAIITIDVSDKSSPNTVTHLRGVVVVVVVVVGTV